MKATSMAFETRYSDDSGVEFAVRLIADRIELESVNTVEFPSDKIDWLIACLERIKAELKDEGVGK